MEEAVEADYIYVMDQGHVVMAGTPVEIFSDIDTDIVKSADHSVRVPFRIKCLIIIDQRFCVNQCPKPPRQLNRFILP